MVVAVRLWQGGVNLTYMYENPRLQRVMVPKSFFFFFFFFWYCSGKEFILSMAWSLKGNNNGIFL